MTTRHGPLVHRAARSATAGAIALVVALATVAVGDQPPVVSLDHVAPTATNPMMVVDFGDATGGGTAAAWYPGERPVGIAANRHGPGYWVATVNGGVMAFGGAPFLGSVSGLIGTVPIAGIAANPHGPGYWLAASDGRVFAFGAPHYGHAPGPRWITGIAANPTGPGYWLLSVNGAVDALGAPFYGSLGGSPAPLTAIAANPTGPGYWIMSTLGWIYPFGGAPDYGQAFGAPRKPLVGLAANPTGTGYWALGVDGGVYPLGGAPYHGTAAGAIGFLPAIAIGATPSGGGYRVVAAPSPRPSCGTAPAGSGSGRRIVYSNSGQRVWMIEADECVASTYPVSGRRGVPAPGTYHVFRKINPGSSGNLRLPYFVGFAWGNTTDIGFHGIPLRPDGSPIQSDDELGEFRSAGCVRQNQDDAIRLWDWTPIGTTVVVLP